MDQNSSSVYWDSQNINYANVTIAPCEVVKSENILRTTSFGSDALPSVNNHVSLETMISEFKRDNARLNEKVDRLALKEETSSFLNLTESQKLRQDVDRIEEINLRLRRCLAERLTKERELQKKIERLQSDLLIKSGLPIKEDDNECLKTHILRHQEIMKFILGSNFFDAVQHGEEHRESLEKKIEQLAANVSAMKRREEKLMKKSQRDNLTIKQLCQKVDAMKYDCKIVDIDACKNSSISNCKNDRKCSENSMMERPPIKNGKKPVLPGGNVSSVKADKDQRASYNTEDVPISRANYSSEQIARNQNLLASISEDNATRVLDLNNVSCNSPPTFFALSTCLPRTDERPQTLLDSAETLSELKYRERLPSHESKLIATDALKKNSKADKAIIGSLMQASDPSLPSMEDPKFIALSQEELNDSNRFEYDCGPSVKKKFLSESIFERSRISKESPETNATSGNQIRNLVEFFETDPKKPLLSNRSICPSSDNNVTFYTSCPQTRMRGKSSDEFIQAEQKSLFQSGNDKYAELVGAKESGKLGMKVTDFRRRFDHCHEKKLSYLEKYIEQLREQLKFVENKLAFVDLNNPENPSVIRRNHSNQSNYKLHESNLSLKDNQTRATHNGETISQQEQFIFTINSDEQSIQKWRALKLDVIKEDHYKANDKNNDGKNVSSISSDSSRKLPRNEYLLGIYKEEDKYRQVDEKICSSIPVSKKFFSSGNVQSILEINVSASLPTQMNVKFGDSKIFGVAEKEDSSENSHPAAQKEGKKLKASTESENCSLSEAEESSKHQCYSNAGKSNCLLERPEELLKNQTHLNFEKYFSLLGNRCLFLETTLKEQEQQYNLLCSALNSKRNYDDGTIEADALSGLHLHEIETAEAVNLSSQSEQNKRFISGLSQSERDSMSNDEGMLSLPKDHQNCELLEKYILKLNIYMKGIEKCLSLQKRMQLHFLNIIQNSSAIKSIDLVVSESLKTVLNPPCSLKETQSHFNENFSRSPSEDNYFMIKACSSKEFLIDQRLFSSNNLNFGTENNCHHKCLKTDEKTKDGMESLKNGAVLEKLDLKASKFKVLEGQCSKLEKHLKIIEANLKYQDAIYHYLETCLLKKKLEIDLAKTSIVGSSQTNSQQKILEPKFQRKRRTSKTSKENKSVPWKDKETVKTNIDKLCNIQSEDPGFLEGSMMKSFKTSKFNVVCDSASTLVLNPVEKEVCKNPVEKSNQIDSPLKKNQEILTNIVYPSETTSENKLNSTRKSVDLKSFLHLSNFVSFVDTQKEKHFNPTITSEVIHRKIQRIGKNTALLEKQLNNHRIKTEERNEIYRQLRKLLKEKELITKYSIKNKLLDG